MEEFRRYEWEEYKTLLERLEYTEEQISAVKEIRENYESMTIDQFNFFKQVGMIVRTRKLTKNRSLYTDRKKIYYLEHYRKQFEYCGYFVEEEV
jgi:hypothetical protein